MACALGGEPQSRRHHARLHAYTPTRLQIYYYAAAAAVAAMTCCHTFKYGCLLGIMKCCNSLRGNDLDDDVEGPSTFAPRPPCTCKRPTHTCATRSRLATTRMRCPLVSRAFVLFRKRAIGSSLRFACLCVDAHVRVVHRCMACARTGIVWRVA